MNAREREQYLREYSILKGQGKPFFPYAIMKDSVMAAITLGVIILMAILFGAELGPKADPTTTTYTPRPEWYFFFLFELLRVVKPPELVFLATIGIPTLCLVLLLMLPFFDRNPERNPLRRPIATIAGIATIAAMAYLTVLGRARRRADGDRAGHRAPVRGGQGDHGLVGLPRLPQDRRERQHARPQPDRDRRTGSARTRSPARSINPTSPMPSYRTLQEEQPGAVRQARRSTSRRSRATSSETAGE